jgi:hypothetical protein
VPIVCGGDFDWACSLTMTHYIVKELNVTITTQWRPWYIPHKGKKIVCSLTANLQVYSTLTVFKIRHTFKTVVIKWV